MPTTKIDAITATVSVSASAVAGAGGLMDMQRAFLIFGAFAIAGGISSILSDFHPYEKDFSYQTFLVKAFTFIFSAYFVGIILGNIVYDMTDGNFWYSAGASMAGGVASAGVINLLKNNGVVIFEWLLKKVGVKIK